LVKFSNENYWLQVFFYFTLLAATMQAVRTAGQEQLSEKLNAMATTAVVSLREDSVTFEIY
jgi:hypothetical protein